MTYIGRAVGAIWKYIKDMNSSEGGGVSIKRNMAWGVCSLLVVVEIYSLVSFPHVKESELKLYSFLCCFYAVLDASFVLLALGITTFEKLSDLVQKLKFGFFGAAQSHKPIDSPIVPEDKKEESEK